MRSKLDHPFRPTNFIEAYSVNEDYSNAKQSPVTNLFWVVSGCDPNWISLTFRLPNSVAPEKTCFGPFWGAINVIAVLTYVLFVSRLSLIAGEKIVGIMILNRPSPTCSVRSLAVGSIAFW